MVITHANIPEFVKHYEGELYEYLGSNQYEIEFGNSYEAIRFAGDVQSIVASIKPFEPITTFDYPVILQVTIF